MKTKKLLSLLLGALFVLTLALTGCGTETVITPNPIPTEDGKGDTPWDKEITTSNFDIAPYFAEGDVAYFTITQLYNPSFVEPYKEEITRLYNEYNSSTGTEYETTWDGDLASSFQWYAIGTITADNAYKNDTLVVLVAPCDGMCIEESLYRFLWNEATGDFTWLPNHSETGNAPTYLDPLLATKDDTLILNGLATPQEMLLPDGINKLTLGSDSYNYFPDTLPGDFSFTSETVGDVYRSGCFYVQLPDGSIARYEYDPGFNFNTEEEGAEDVTITWNDNSTTNLTQNYKYKPTGCGISGNCYLVEEVTEANLTVVGKTSNGFDIYEVEGLAGLEPPVTTEIAIMPEQSTFLGEYNNYVEMQTAYEAPVKTYAEYLALHPKVYFKDPLGQFGSLMQIEIAPPVECGKPVIYLYPTKTTTVRVKVGIDEITYSDPAYGDNGWTVVAQPDGTLTNLADGMTYPYLFWEGLSKTGVTPTSGFMVARENIETFLNDSLTQLGLTTQEKADFMEYWVSRMLNFDEPYFYVTFVGTQDFNKIAPLEISPKPNTLIRVFMYFDPVTKPFQVQEQTLVSVPRRGFTVVEWGGTASRPWKK
ncbi:MAG: hypothetical protein WC882_04440 [Candidatus Gracilibacteria bacterium]